MQASATAAVRNHFEPPPRLEQVLENRAIAGDIWQLDMTWQGTDVEAGQFVNLLPATAGAMPLRRPISIADLNMSKRQMTLIYRVVGRGTAALAQLRAGSDLDVLGPLGHGFPLPPVSTHTAARRPRALAIGGGVGIPPMYLQGVRLLQAGWDVEFQLGVRSAEQLFWYERFAALGRVRIASDDGSVGTHGTVATLWDAEPQPDNLPDAVYACGPLPMLRAIKEYWHPLTPTYLSLEERMACGTGACYACVVPDAEVSGHQYRICYEGPVFAARKVVL